MSAPLGQAAERGAEIPRADVAAALGRTLAQVPGPVTIVTTTDGDGRHWGFTASAFCPLSLDPPLLLVCLNRGSASHAAFLSTERFLVNVLADDQAELAARFGRLSGTAKFVDSGMVPCENGLPGVRDAAARLACSMHAVTDGGDHSILIGRVIEARRQDRRPLVYWDRHFGFPARLG